ncbi:4607_t:CDS:1, partial [Scutellospora calospora]
FPWHLFSDRDNIVLSDKDAIEIKGVLSFQTFDNPTPISQPLLLNESLLIIPSINLEIKEKETKELAIIVKICKEGKPYREVVMELNTGLDVTWITFALFNFLKLKKIISDEIIYRHSRYEILVVCKAEVIIKIRKVKSKIIVYVNNDINYLNRIISKDLMKAMNLNILISKRQISVSCNEHIFKAPLCIDKNCNILQSYLSDNK